MLACGACGYSKINHSASHCPRCGEALGADGGAGAVAGGSRKAAGVSETQATPRDNISHQEMEQAKAASWEWSPAGEQAKGAGPRPSAAPSIGGWLIIPAIHMIWRMTDELLYPLVFAFLAVMGTHDVRLFHAFPGFEYFIYYGLIAFTALAIRWVYVCIWFFKRSANTPAAFVHQFWALSINYLVIGVWILLLSDSEFRRDKVLLYGFVIIGYAVFVFVMSIVYRTAFARSKRAEATFIYSPPNAKNTAPRIGGWLYIPALHIVLHGGYTAYNFYGWYKASQFWLLFKVSWLGIHYFMFFNLLAYFILIVGWIKVGFMFARRRSKAPLVFNIQLFIITLVMTITIIWSNILKLCSIEGTICYSAEALSILFIAMFYTITFRKSKRAKATFVN